jgi:enamine deaminase RidA (YjgF/YER057c/UK114 family)
MSARVPARNHGAWPGHTAFSAARTCGELIVVGGQVDLDADGRVEHPRDLIAQITACTRHARDALHAAGAHPAQIVKIVVYCVAGTADAVQAAEAQVLAGLGVPEPPVITMVPVPWMALPGVLASVEVTASTRIGAESPAVVTRPSAHHPTAGSHSVRAGRFIFTSAQMTVAEDGSVEDPGDIVSQSRGTMDRIAALLAEHGAGLDDAVKFNIYYVGEGTYEDWEVAAKIRAGYFTEPGPVATGIPVPALERPGLLIKMEVWAMLGEDGRHLPRQHVWPDNHWDWAIHLPYKHGLRCEEMFFIGGQIATDDQGTVLEPADTAAQTRQCLTYIERVVDLLDGVQPADVAKTTTFYKGEPGKEVHALNAGMRNEWFGAGAPVTSDVALPALAFEDMMIEIEVLGARQPSE